MKAVILKLIDNGIVHSKRYRLADLARRFYPLIEIAEDSPDQQAIIHKKNPFWEVDNMKNRFELLADFAKSEPSVKGMHPIFNRYVNGDRYGIV